MNTIFTVETTKGSKLQYTIDLGQDILDGESDSSIFEMASQSKRIKEQGKLRGCNSETEIQALMIKAGYPNVTVTEGVVKVQSVNAQYNELEKIIGKEALAEMIAAKLAEQKS